MVNRYLWLINVQPTFYDAKPQRHTGEQDKTSFLTKPLIVKINHKEPQMADGKMHNSFQNNTWLVAV